MNQRIQRSATSLYGRCYKGEGCDHDGKEEKDL